MLNVLQKLCESNNFVVHEFVSNIEGVNSKIAVPDLDNDHQEYYLILECKSADDKFIANLANNHAEKFMDDLEELEYANESLRKNSTIFLCCENSNISEQSLLQFEENPYYFKKNVITYSKEELTSLTEVINNQFSNEHLNKLIMNGDLFESFKTLSLDSHSHYPLLIRLITKLPFVHYIPQLNQLDDLETFVRSELEEPSIKLIDFICEDDGIINDELINAKISSNWDEL